MYTAVLILHQIPVLHTKFSVTCGRKCNFEKTPVGLQLRCTPAVTKRIMFNLALQKLTPFLSAVIARNEILHLLKCYPNFDDLKI